MRYLFEAAILMSALSIGGIGEAQPCPEPAGGWGWGSSYGHLWHWESHAYYGAGKMMVTLDMSDPNHPVQTNAAEMPGFVTRMAFNGKWLYAGIAEQGIAVFDLSKPDAPVAAGPLYPTYLPLDMAVYGSYLLVADVYSGLRVLSIQDPVSPVEVACLSSLRMPMDLVVSGARLYVTDYEQGLFCVDLSDPVYPQILGSYRLSDVPTTLSVRDHRVYVAAGYEGLSILDWSDPAHPVVNRVLEWPHFISGFVMDGDIGYLMGWDHFAIYDLSLPDDPRPLAIWQGLEGMNGLTIQNAVGYLYDDYQGWFVLNLSTPANPNIVGHWVDGGHLGVPLVAGGHLYVPQMKAGWRIFDVSDPSAPSPIAFHPYPGYITRIEVQGRFAYLLVQDEGVLIYDISDPAHPIPFGLYPASARDIKVEDGTMYLVSEWGLRAISILNPGQPFLLGGVSLPGGCSSLWIAGSHAFCGTIDGGLQIIDIASPSEPVALGYYPLCGGLTSNLSGEGSLLYCTSDYRQLNILDVSAPADPKLISTLSGWKWATAIHAGNQRVFLSDEYKGVCVVDVQVPQAPALRGCHPSLFSVGAVETEGNWLYVGTRSTGLVTYSLDGCADHRRPVDKPVP